MLFHEFQQTKRGLYRHLADPNYQKYITTLSHDSGDIKNVGNGLITKKLQAFEHGRNLYHFTQLL